MTEIFHGGGLDAAIAQYGGKREGWLDLSTGINPNPYPVPEISTEAWTRLPDKSAEQALLDAARNYYQVPDGFEVVAAPGTQALIQVLPRILQAREVAIFSPTYVEHRHVWENTDANITEISVPDDIMSSKQIAVVVNPNNPTGHVLSTDELLSLSREVDALIVDEAFCDAIPECSIVSELSENTLVLKSFGKFFGLAGLRLGFAICNKEWASKLNSMLGPWAVSGPALQIGLQAIGDTNWIAETRLSLKEQSHELAVVLKNSGLEIAGQTSLFVYVRHQNAASIHDRLAENHILVRPFLERSDYLRFGLCKNSDELVRLEAALRALPGV